MAAIEDKTPPGSGGSGRLDERNFPAGALQQDQVTKNQGKWQLTARRKNPEKV
jgi:hypothetical protein